MTQRHLWQLQDEADTVGLAGEIALFAKAGDWIGLTGDLGTGKTTFARALVRAYHDAPVDVPSPTFTLVQVYEDGRVPVAHFDLYRLNDMAEVDELGMDDLAADHLIVVEWAERLQVRLPADRLMIELQAPGDRRQAEVVGFGAWQERLARMVDVRRFVTETAEGVTRRFLQGDASTRRYERLIADDGTTKVLMDMPARSDPASTEGGVAYSKQVHLAENITAVLAINAALRKAGLSAPDTFSHDLDSGLAVISDFGDKVFGTLANYGSVADEPITTAVDVLAAMASMSWPREVKIDGARHVVAEFDAAALLAEATLVPEWFLPLANGRPAKDDQLADYAAAWQPLLRSVQDGQRQWVLRDYHSPNLIWLPDRAGLARVGIIDTQDAVIGSPAYDLASLLQDARVDVAAEVEAALFDRYRASRLACDRTFDEQQFRRSYAILGAQRAAKILGIFARLAARDGKHGYLRHIARVSGILERNLRHPALGEVKQWFDDHLPPARRAAAGKVAA